MDIAITGSPASSARRSAPRCAADGHRVVARRALRPAGDRRGRAGTRPPAPSTPPASRASTPWSTSPARASPRARGPTTQRDRIHDSRSAGHRRCSPTALAGLDRPPAVLVSGSAIGYYGDRGDEVLTEASAPGDDFLAEVCLRLGGAPPRPPPRRRHPGGPPAHRDRARRHGRRARQAAPDLQARPRRPRPAPGDQWMSWITLDDEVRRHPPRHRPRRRSPGRSTSPRPSPVTNAEFTEAARRRAAPADVPHHPPVRPPRSRSASARWSSRCCSRRHGCEPDGARRHRVRVRRPASSAGRSPPCCRRPDRCRAAASGS